MILAYQNINPGQGQSSADPPIILATPKFIGVPIGPNFAPDLFHGIVIQIYALSIDRDFYPQ